MRPSIAQVGSTSRQLVASILPASPRVATRPPPARWGDQRRSQTRGGRDSYHQNEDFLRDVAETNDEERSRTSSSNGRSSFSRDMRDEAESSSTPWLQDLLHGQSSGRDADNEPADNSPRQPFSLGDPNHPTLPRQERPSFSPTSVSRSFEPHWRDSSAMQDRPRVLKGVHNRRKRAEGSTPAEAAAMNALIDQMLKSMPGISPIGSGSGSASGGLYGPDRGGDLFGPRRFFPTPLPGDPARAGRPAQRILEKLESEEDSIVLEMLDGLKEEMGMCRTDVDLIAWAKEKVFAPSIPGTPGKGVDDPAYVGPTFSPVYPRILTHLLSYVRRYFNNPHLVLALFHHAQTQSPESYLSGCLAPAYNEILKLRWESFRDLEGVEAGVREMESNGIAWDRGTSKTISKIIEEVGEEVWSGTGWQNKYGKDVHLRLARLEDRLQRDIMEQNRMYELKGREKAGQRAQARRFEERRERFGEGGRPGDEYKERFKETVDAQPRGDVSYR